MTRTLLICLLLGMPVPLLTAADWPRFRGINGTGQAEAAPAPSPKSQLWKVEVPGKGHSSPIVAKGKVFLQSTSDDNKKRFLICLDATDGKILWSREVPGSAAATHKKNNTASSTPATDGELVYCVFWDGQNLILSAYDFTGKAVWSNNIGAYQSDHGAGHSPVVYGSKVFVNFDQDKQAAVVAFDAKTGSKSWSVERKAHRASYTTPFLLEQPGKPAQLVVASTTGIDALDPNTGAVGWHYSINWPTTKMLRMVGGPVYAGGKLIAYTGEGGNDRYIVALDPSGKGDITKTAKAWDRTKQCPYVPCMLARGEMLFWVDDNGRAFGADAKSGKVLWDSVLFGGAVTASPILIGDEVLAISEKGQVAVFKAANEFDLVSKGEIGEGVYASPAVADGRVYVRGFTHLYCYGVKP